jgi:alpha-glucosidase
MIEEKTTTEVNDKMKKRANNFNRSIGSITRIEKIAQGLLLQTDTENVALVVYSENTIRIRISKKIHEKEDFSYAVVGKPLETDFSIAELADTIVLKTNALKLVLHTNPFRVSFYTLDNQLINEDHASFGTSWIGTEVTTYKTLHPNEKYIGLGEKTGNLNRRGKAYTNWNTDNFAYPVDDDPIYLSTPFYIGIKDQLPYGIFLDNTYKTIFNFGASNDRFMYFQAEDGEMNYYFIHHPKVADIITSYTALTGRMELPPLWSLGFQQCRYSYYPDYEVLNAARTFREKNIPADVIYLDIHYMDAYKVFTWHNKRFPDPKKLTDELRALNFDLAVIIDPGVKREEGYAAYEEGVDKDLFVKYPDGVHYSGQVWPGWSCFPDFTDEKTRAWWGEKLNVLTENGVTGFWNDMNEPAAWGQHLPDLIEFEYEGEGATHKKARNVYGMQMARSTYEGAKKLLNGKRPFILTRAGFCGVQRYGAVWTGDNVATEEHMMAGVRLINSMGLAGVPFAGYDVGGFAGEASPDLFARWIMLGAFSPFFRAHSMVNSRDSEPWTFGEEVEDISRNYIRLRYKIMPYIYSTFFESTQNGLPIARSLAIDYTFDEQVYQNQFQHQYLFGKNLLIIPTESFREYTKMYLPEGKWFNLYTDELLDGGKEMLIEVSKEILPIYVKAGGFMPSQTAVQSLKIKPETTLRLHVWGEDEGDFIYYEDDGNTYAFEQGNYCKRVMNNKYADGKLILEKQEGTYTSHFSIIKVILHGFKNLKEEVLVNGNKMNVKYEAMKYIEPISDYDPYHKPPKPPMYIENVPFVEIENSKNEIILTWKF